jgi:hypothetical protein
MCVALFESCPDKSVADKKDKIVYQGEGTYSQTNGQFRLLNLVYFETYFSQQILT